MHQIKIFKGLESEIPLLEKQVNDWLETSGAKVVKIFGNVAAQSMPDERQVGLTRGAWPPSDVLLIVHYEK